MQKKCDNRQERWNEELNKNKEMKCKEIEFWRGDNEFVYWLKKCNMRKIENKIYVNQHEDDLIKFSWHYTQYFTRNRIFI